MHMNSFTNYVIFHAIAEQYLFLIILKLILRFIKLICSAKNNFRNKTQRKRKRINNEILLIFYYHSCIAKDIKIMLMTTKVLYTIRGLQATKTNNKEQTKI